MWRHWVGQAKQVFLSRSRFRPLWFALAALVVLCTPAQAQNFNPSGTYVDNFGQAGRLRVEWWAPPDDPSAYYGTGSYSYECTFYRQTGSGSVTERSAYRDAGSRSCDFTDLTPGSYDITISTYVPNVGYAVGAVYTIGTVIAPAPAAPTITSASAGNGTASIQ